MTRPGLVLALVLVLAGCSDDVDDAAPTTQEAAPAATAITTIEPGVLTACVAPVPGLLEQADGDWTGSEVEVLEHVADGLALELAFEPVSFDELVSGVALNGMQCDIGAGAVVDGEALEAVVRPSASYGQLHRLVVTPGAAEEVPPEEVTGRVGVEEAGAAEDAVDLLTAAEVVPFPSVPDLERALEGEQIEAVLVTWAGWDQLGRPDVRSRVPTGGDLVLVLPLGAEDESVEAVDGALGSLTP